VLSIVEVHYEEPNLTSQSLIQNAQTQMVSLAY
jgi:hypothetical protein